MKVFTWLNSYLLAVIFLLAILKSGAQEIGVLGNGVYIADNDVTPTTADFTDFGTATSRTYTIDNVQATGNTTLSVTSISISNTTDFTITSNPAPVDVGKNGPDPTFTITLNTLTAGTYTSTVSILSSNAGNDGVDNAWTFTIRSIRAPEINIRSNATNIADGDTTPSVADNTDFGSTVTGVPVTKTFTIQNIGSTALNLTDASPYVVISGANAADFSITAVPTTPIAALTGTTTFNIRFNPSTVGVKNATISIANNDSDENPYDFSIRGTGTPPLPEIAVTGNGANIVDGTTSTSLLNHTAFGNTGISTPVVRTYTINNSGTGTLNITTPVTLGSTGTATGTYYSVTTQPATSVAPGGSTTFQVTFNPTIRGEFIDLVSIVNDDTDEGLFEFAISGTSYMAASGDTWYYLDSGVDLPTTLPGWKTDTGIYSTWSAGQSQLGFGDGDEVTTINNHGGITYYFRKQVTASAADAARSTLVLRALRDDGIIIYINGVKVWQNNMTASTVTYTTPASSNISGNLENAWHQYKLVNILNTGINEIAVEIHQDAPGSSDVSFDFSMYTEDGNIPPDVDGDFVVDYLDSDVDNDGVPDIAEGCYTANLYALHTNSGTGEQSINSTINGTTISMDDGNTITFGKTGSFVDITSYLAGEHGWAVRVRGGPSNGTITFNYGTPVNDLFFKLADFDENERWTVNAYDDSNNLIDLGTSGNVYQLGSYINQTGNYFSEKFLGNGINNNGDAVNADPFGSIYFYFPNTLISRIEFVIDQPQGSTIRIAAMHYCGLDTDGDGIDDYHDSDSDNDGIPDLVEAGGYDTDGDGLADDFTDTDGDGLADIFDTTPALYFAYEVSKLPDYDFDGDGKPSRIDLDSDNDGILDILEAGGIDVDGNGQIDGFLDTNNDGYHDAFDGAGSMLITGGDGNGDGMPDSYPFKNQDGTGLPNFMDIDSDDDGITDNTEAQATGSYIAFVATDTDGDGIPDVFDNSGSWGGNGLIPVDTDGDGTPDYLDLDSDDGEEPDNIEGHDTNGDGVIDGSDTPNANTGIFTGTDTDGDGLDDGYDNNNSTYDATNNSLQATSHPIFDGGADRDWRHTQIALDFDGLNDHIDYGDEAAYEFNSSFSIEAWVLQENTTATGTIASKSNAKAGNEKGYKLVLNNSVPNLKWYDNSSVLVVNLISPYAISNDRWYHIAATYDGTTAKLFIDGIEVASDTPASAPSYDTEKFLIGATYDSDTPTTPKHYFDGFIDEVRIWNVALTANQLHEMMNQEVEQNGTAVRGKIIPLDISGGLQWANLEGYYDMNDDDADDKSSNSRHGSPKNITTLQLQTAPLPYTTKADGNWSDNTGTTPWTLGDTVWDEPNGMGIDGVTPIDWNIVVTDHNVDIDTYATVGRDRKVLGLIVNANKIQINGDNATQTGNGLTVSRYLKLDGNIDLEGESQLIQSEGSILDVNSPGRVEKDQQGTRDLFTYNYWSSPFGVSNIVSNNNSYTLPNIFKDGTNSSSPANITFLTSGYNGSAGTPISIADYWIWKYANQGSNNYSAWQHVRSTGSILAGEGFTMKGVTNTSGNVNLQQNYVINGKPNNGDINLTLAANNDYLVGNPYPSALDANEFILDNTGIPDGGRNASGNVINGALYFWDHFGGGSHTLSEYQGGYATYTLMGGAAAIANDARINATGGVGTKIPERYIPVGQGFFVSSVLDAGLVGLTQPVVGGTILFKNSQRIFKKEAVTGSNTGSVFLRTNGSGNSKSKSSAQKTSGEDLDLRQKIWLMYDSPKGYHRQLLVGMDKNASNDFDMGYEAQLIENNKEDMFWEFNNNKFTIQAVNNFDANQVLPLGIKTNKTGISRIKIHRLENIPDETKIYIHDKNTDTYHNLRASDFEFSVPIGNHSNRYEITFNDGSPAGESLGVYDHYLDGVSVYYANESESIVVLNPDLEEIETIELMNILGQSIKSIKNPQQNEYSEYKIKHLSPGTYVLKMHTVSGSVSKKVLVK